MSQKDKARERANELEFEFRTKLNPEELVQVLEASAGAAAPGGLKGSMRCTSKQMSADQLSTHWDVRGPGGIKSIMKFVVSGRYDGSATSARVDIGDFIYAKGQLFMPPSVAAAPQMRRFKDLVLAQAE